MENELETLAVKYGTDKQLSCHGYTKFYDKHFKEIRNDSLKILEIGVHKGYSLNMWADYFQNSIIYGIDDGSSGDLQEVYENTRINFRKGRQDDINFLGSLLDEVGGSFDIIIDDGSHYSTDIIFSFEHLFNYTNKWYVIEDLQTSYPPYTLEGLKSRFNNIGPTATQYIAALTDAHHVQGIKNLIGFHTYKEITFLEK